MKNDNIDINVDISCGSKNFITYTMDFTKKYIETNTNTKTNKKSKKSLGNDEDIFKRPTPLKHQKEQNKGNNPEVKKKNSKQNTKANLNEKKVLRSSRR